MKSIKAITNQENSLLLLIRFKQIAFISLTSITFGTLVFISQLKRPYPENEIITLGLLLAMIICNIASLILIEEKKRSLSVDIFLWSISIVATGIIWLGGGLRDIIIATYPVILVLAGLLGNTTTFMGVFSFLTVMTVMMTITDIYEINTNSYREFTRAQTIYVLLTTITSCFITWIFNLDFKKTLDKLKEENDNVRQSQEKINHLANHDPLTGLLRRASGEERYQHMLNTIDFKQDNLFLYFLDLDNFKNINDYFDHSAGDSLLIEVSRRLSTLLKPSDTISRIGGDEFLMILARPQSFNDQAFAKEILHQVTQPVILHGNEVDITVSIGIAMAPRDGSQFEEIRKKADLALYKAKQQGKNTFHYYDDILHQATLRKAFIASTLKRAVRNNLLELHFQPKINITTGTIAGAEALLRWVKDNPNRVEPKEFIPLIESTDVIIEIGQWVIQEACMHCQRWHDAGYPISVAVNISGMQLARHNLKATINSALKHSGLPPKFLEVELTEHLLTTGSNAVLNQLDDIKSIGIDLSIDDFGTGYSSLSYLTKFKVDALKLDQSFISEISHSAESLAIVKAIISMAHIIGLTTIAEGVESIQELDILQDLGCKYGQGYLWSEALPDSQFIKLLNNKKNNSKKANYKEKSSTLLPEEAI